MPGETLDHLDAIAWWQFDTYVEFVDQIVEARLAQQQGDSAPAGAVGSEADPVPEALENSPFAGVWDDNVVYLPQAQAG